jgi:hypothetical protein
MLQRNSLKNEELDRFGRLILKAAVADEKEVDAAASAPFLFRRVRAAIDRERSSEPESGGWLSWILVARRAVPAMALVAVLAAVLTILSIQLSSTSLPNQSDEEALFGVTEPGVEQTVLASRNGLSRDDVFNIVVDRNYEVKAK